MSDLNAINTSNISFSGKDKTEKKEHKEVRGEHKNFAEKLTQPVKDEFKKRYGEDAKADPSLVADFAADSLVKAGVMIGGTALLLAKSRKATNGLTSALKESFGKVKNNADGKEVAQAAGNIVTKLKGAFAKVKENNLDDANRFAQKAKEEGKTLKDTISNQLLKPKEFEEGTKLAGFIDNHFGKNAKKVKEMLGKAGIANGDDLVDTAVAGGATVALSGGVNSITDDVTSKDNKELAHEARVNRVEQFLNTASKLADTAQYFAG